jgi:putative transposase
VSNDKIIKQISWRRLDGNNQSPKFVLGVTFNDGIEVIANPTDRQPATAAA